MGRPLRSRSRVHFYLFFDRIQLKCFNFFLFFFIEKQWTTNKSMQILNYVCILHSFLYLNEIRSTNTHHRYVRQQRFDSLRYNYDKMTACHLTNTMKWTSKPNGMANESKTKERKKNLNRTETANTCAHCTWKLKKTAKIMSERECERIGVRACGWFLEILSFAKCAIIRVCCALSLDCSIVSVFTLTSFCLCDAR